MASRMRRTWRKTSPRTIANDVEQTADKVENTDVDVDVD